MTVILTNDPVAGNARVWGPVPQEQAAKAKKNAELESIHEALLRLMTLPPLPLQRRQCVFRTEVALGAVEADAPDEKRKEGP